jgi:hypothetical protein
VVDWELKGVGVSNTGWEPTRVQQSEKLRRIIVLTYNVRSQDSGGQRGGLNSYQSLGGPFSEAISCFGIEVWQNRDAIPSGPEKIA